MILPRKYISSSKREENSAAKGLIEMSSETEQIEFNVNPVRLEPRKLILSSSKKLLPF